MLELSFTETLQTAQPTIESTGNVAVSGWQWDIEFTTDCYYHERNIKVTARWPTILIYRAAYR